MDITKIIYEIATQQFGTQEYNEGTSFESLGADSLDLADFYMEVEEEFEMVIPDEDILAMKTLADVIAYVSAHMSQLRP